MSTSELVIGDAKRRPLLILLLCVVLSVVALIGALRFGSVAIPAGEWLEVLGGAGSDLHRRVVFELRLPRALNAFAVGALLSMAGALMQVLLRNPLADPYILGISSGAAVAALMLISAGASVLSVQLGAFGGALAVTLLVYQIAHSTRGFAPVRLLLTGVVIAAGLNALISVLLALGDDSSLRGMLFWLMGDFSFAGSPQWPLLVAALGVISATVFARHLDVLVLGDKQAAILGLGVGAARIGIYVSASLLTAVAVTTAGSIGFVGLVVPHTIRLVCGPTHRVLLPASALLGGALLVAADTAARTIVAPRQLPVGALTAMIGVPFFLVLMRRAQRSS